MIFKVHWIIDGIAEIDAKTKTDAEQIVQEGLESYVKDSDVLMNKYVAKSIQGTAFEPGTDEKKENDEKQNKKNPNEEDS